MIAVLAVLVVVAVAMAWWTRPVTFEWPFAWDDPHATLRPPPPDPDRVVPIIMGPHPTVTWGGLAASTHYQDFAVATGRLLPPDDTGLIAVEVHVPSGWRAPLTRHRIRTRSMSGDWRPIDGDTTLIGIAVVDVAGHRAP